MSTAQTGQPSVAALADRYSLHLSSELMTSIEQRIGVGGLLPELAPSIAYEASLDRSTRRSVGVFYTPAHLVEFCVERTLAPLLKDLTLEGVLKLRIADISCGGGVFLLGALRYLSRFCMSHHPLAVAATGGACALRMRLVREVLQGIDIDPMAAEVCKLSLMLAVGTGYHGEPPHITVADALLGETLPAGLDAVIGNPPWGQKAFALTPEMRQQLKCRFRCARKGVLDPYKLFIERSHELLRLGGRVGLVLPDIILLKNQEGVRRLLLEETTIDCIAHVGRAFENANIDAVIIVARKGAPPPDHEVEAFVALTAPGGRDATDPVRLPQHVFGTLPGARLNIHLSPSRLRVVEHLKSFNRFGNAFEIHEGVHTGNCRDKLFVDREGPLRERLILGRKELRPYTLKWAGKWIDLSVSPDRSKGEYANIGRRHWYQGAKIVVRRTGDRVIAARDDAGFYVSNNLFVLLSTRDLDAVQLAAHVALLNSEFMTWYFRVVQPRQGRLFAELKITHLRDFPVPSDISSLGALSLQQEVESDVGTQHEIDRRVASLYGVTRLDNGEFDLVPSAVQSPPIE